MEDNKRVKIVEHAKGRRQQLPFHADVRLVVRCDIHKEEGEPRSALKSQQLQRVHVLKSERYTTLDSRFH